MENNLCITICQYITTWLWPYIIGYLYFLVFGGIFVRKIMNELKSEVRFNVFSEDEKKVYSWYAKRVGDLDGILYITSLIFGYPQFIAIWLAFKVAGRWESARLEAERLKKASPERWLNKDLILNNALYNLFTIGNALSIIYAITGWRIIVWLQKGQPDRVILIGIAVIIGSFVFNELAKKQTIRFKKI